MKGWVLAIGVAVLWSYPEARVVTANFLRNAADFLSPTERPVEQRNSNKNDYTIRRAIPQ